MDKKSAKLRLIVSAIFIVIAIVLLLLPVEREKIPPPAGNVEKDHGLRVTRVIDGDTFVLSDSSEVRLIGIDTPEKGQPYYNEAKQFAANAVLGKIVRIEPGIEPFDSYGRLLGYVYVDTAMINRELLEAGLAVVYTFEENQKYVGNFIASQKRARTRSLAIWSLPYDKEDYYIRAGNSFRFHRPFCPNLKNANKNNLVRLTGREQALDLGLSPCRFCRP